MSERLSQIPQEGRLRISLGRVRATAQVVLFYGGIAAVAVGYLRDPNAQAEASRLGFDEELANSYVVARQASSDFHIWVEGGLAAAGTGALMWLAEGIVPVGKKKPAVVEPPTTLVA